MNESLIDRKRVYGSLTRARTFGLPATLTHAAWCATVDHFSGKCVYCDAPAEIIEHFVSVINGGGTTAGNCVPACYACNNAKMTYDAEWAEAAMGAEKLGALVGYLKSVSTGPDVGAPVLESARMNSIRLTLSEAAAAEVVRVAIGEVSITGVVRALLAYAAKAIKDGDTEWIARVREVSARIREARDAAGKPAPAPTKRKRKSKKS